jgi:hypothetical protein
VRWHEVETVVFDIVVVVKFVVELGFKWIFLEVPATG